MSQKLKEINGDTTSFTTPLRNGATVLENGANTDLSSRKAALTPLEHRVTQQRETERPFSNKYNKHWDNGTYHCIVCDAELFKSETKFESKSGWPAFYNVVDPRRVKLTPDLSHVGANLLLLVAKPDLARTEVSCACCNAHLGHLFKDGPKPTGLRYCINSSSLNFKTPDGMLMSMSTNNGLLSPVTTNGNGALPAPIREYACNPENRCSRSAATTPTTPTPKSFASTPISNKEFCGRTARDNFFSSFENNSNGLPPMGALCLNNQSCQRVPVVKKKPSTEDILNSSLISNGAENNLNNFPAKSGIDLRPTVNGGTSRQSAGTANFAVTTTSATTTHKTTATTNITSPTTTTPVTSKSRFAYSKGTSLTAARINFFQKIASRQESPSPSRWATTFNSRWSSTANKSSNTPENSYVSTNGIVVGVNRFPNSCSSGSLCTASQPLKEDEVIPIPQPRRSASSFFSSSSSSSSACPTPRIEQISSPPRPITLRETTL